LLETSSNQNTHHLLNEELFSDAEPYFSSLIKSINAAQTSIDMEVYIYEANTLGQNIANALRQAAARGVHVRLLIDGIGIDSHFKAIANKLEHHGAEIRIHRPLPWRVALWKYSVSKKTGIAKLLFLLASLNRRNHRKTVIIDKKEVFVGSVNISHNHLHLNHGGQQWRDTAIKISNGQTQAIRQAFNIAWNDINLLQRKARIKKSIAQAMASPYLLNYSKQLRKHHRLLLLNKIRHASKSILITNAYFVPESSLLKALCSAARRGVEVKIILPEKSDVFFMPWVSAFFYKALLRSSARIFEYQPSMLHAKTMIIDQWASVGSSNLNHRSFRKDLEIDYIIQKEASALKLRENFERDIEYSNEQKLKKLGLNKGWRLWLGGLILIILGRWL